MAKMTAVPGNRIERTSAFTIGSRAVSPDLHTVVRIARARRVVEDGR